MEHFGVFWSLVFAGSAAELTVVAGALSDDAGASFVAGVMSLGPVAVASVVAVAGASAPVAAGAATGVSVVAGAGALVGVAFDTTGGTQHITQSRQTISRTAASGAAPDFKGAIGVTANGVEGVDITVPVYAFTYTYYLAPEAVTQSFRLQIFALTGKVNSGSFRGFAAGEVLFLGATGSVRRGEKWEITFRFAASQNRTNINVGGITVPSKKGWEYLWVRYAEQEDTAAQTIVQQPVAAYVERVYDEASFAPLEISV